MSCKFVAAIGYSEGGLKPLLSFFDHVPHDQVTYILLRHIPLNQRSELCEILKQHSKLQIVEAEDGMAIQNDTVYIPPASKYMTLRNDTFHLISRAKDTTSYNFSIDIFLESLAKDKGEKSIAIILSGTGVDGAVGVTKIHEAGGYVIVQKPTSCEASEMPKKAIQTNCVDKVLLPSEMPEVIVKRAQPIIENANLKERLMQ